MKAYPSTATLSVFLAAATWMIWPAAATPPSSPQPPGSSSIDNFQLVYPSDPLVQNSFVEFRVRNPGGDSLTGHAFVALGYYLPNGQPAYRTIAGYYRKESPGENFVMGKIMAIISAPGEVSYRVEDAHADTIMRYPSNEWQALRVLDIIQNVTLDPGNFSVLSNNCVQFMNDVAHVLGLQTKDMPPPPAAGSLVSPTPMEAIKYIRDHNEGVQPIKQDKIEQGILKSFRDRVERAAASVAIIPLPADYNQMADAHNDDPNGPNASPGSGPVPTTGPSTQGGGSGNDWMEFYLLGLPGGSNH